MDENGEISVLYLHSSIPSGAILTNFFGSIIAFLAMVYACQTVDKNYITQANKLLQLNLPSSFNMGDDINLGLTLYLLRNWSEVERILFEDLGMKTVKEKRVPGDYLLRNRNSTGEEKFHIYPAHIYIPSTENGTTTIYPIPRYIRSIL